MAGVGELSAAAAEFLIIGEEAIVVAEEEAGLFYAFGEEIAETANTILREIQSMIQSIAEEREAAAGRVIDQFVGL